MPRVFPLTKTNWDSPQASTADVIDVTMGKTGLHSVTRNGARNVRNTWEINCLVDNKQQIESFIHAHGGVHPFNFNLDGVSDPRLWICGLDDFNFTRMDATRWQFSALFREVRRFGV